MTHHRLAPPSLATSPVVQICTLSFQSADDGSQDSQQPRILAAIHLVRLTYKSEGSFAPFLARRPITALRHDCATCKANCHHGTFRTRYTLRCFTDCRDKPLQGWIVIPQCRHWSVQQHISNECRAGQSQSCQLRHSSALERHQRVTSKDLWSGHFAALADEGSTVWLVLDRDLCRPIQSGADAHVCKRLIGFVHNSRYTLFYSISFCNSRERQLHIDFPIKRPKYRYKSSTLP